MRSLAAYFLTLFSLFFFSPATAAERTIIVLDASGSMWGQIDGKTKIEIARETLSEVLKTVPADTELGLMAYGHREKGSCSDIELAVPPAAGTAREIKSFADKVNPKGKTPLSEAVKKAAEALRYTEDKATVVLVTDGLETCEADPCALGTELEKSGVDFTVHVVGFGLTKDEGKQVACLAENTGGKYFEAADAGQLAEALKETVAEPPKPEPRPEPKKPEFNVTTDAMMCDACPSLGDDAHVHWEFFAAGADGKRTGDSVDGGYGAAHSFNLPPGNYIGVASLGRIDVDVPFSVSETETAKPVANLNAGTLIVIPKRTPDDTAPDDSAHVQASFAGLEDGGYGKTEIFVTAGDVKLAGDIGPAKAEQTVTLAAGETRTIDLVIGSGIVVPSAVYAAGGAQVEGGAIHFQVESATKDINGKRAYVDGTYGVGSKMNIPAGDFVLTADLGSAAGEAPFTVKAGESVDVNINLDAGVLAISAPGGYAVEILTARKDIQGNRRQISGGYGNSYQDTLPAGDYLVRVTYEGDKAPAEKAATVTAGERLEVTVE